MAILISLVALSIDAMLPALPDIGRDLGTSDPNQPQLVLTALFLGLSIGQLFYGPLSDSIGRKPAVYLGLAIFILGCGFVNATSELHGATVVSGLTSEPDDKRLSMKVAAVHRDGDVSFEGDSKKAVI